MKINVFLFLVLTTCLVSSVSAATADFSNVPGVVVAHTPASSGIYFGSPGIAVIDDRTYLAKCDEFGPGSKEYQHAITVVFRSRDRGKTWQQVARIEGLFWASIFTHRDSVYLLGMDKHHGSIVVMRSDDAGDSWTEPTDGDHGLLTSQGEFHTAPMSLVTHDGRLWRAVEDAMGGKRWGSRYRARMLSIPLDADLMSQSSWTLSEPLPSDSKWLDGDFGGWLEGNAVVNREGRIVNILRVACPEGGKAAVVRVSSDGQRLEFDPRRDIIDFPGGAKKFTIRYDEPSKAYWTLVNPVVPRHENMATAGSIRNTLALMRSTDLRHWETRCILLYHPDVSKHGFQYPDWLFDGNDMIAAIRTAFDDSVGGAHNAHDANFLTFHRFANFRSLAMADSEVDLKRLEALPTEVTELNDVSIRGRLFSIMPFGSDSRAFSNRSYTWQEVPDRLQGWTYTQTGGGERATIEVTAKNDKTLHIASTRAWAKTGLPGWRETGETFLYTDANRTRMSILERDVNAGETVKLRQGSWTGTLLLLPSATR